jgi:uncharacterized protein (TIGR00725 family)
MSFSIKLGTGGSVLIDGRSLDQGTWRVACAGIGPAAVGQAITATQAMMALSRTASLRHLVIGVIGPRDASPAQVAAARAMGQSLGGLGLTVICGGRSGVMEAVSAGVANVGGLVIGILPGSTPNEANPFVGIPLPTGLGEARNMVIAKAARVLVAVGGSYGTLSEVAYGLHFGKAVIGLEGAPAIEGVQHADTVEAAVELAMTALLDTALADRGPAP